MRSYDEHSSNLNFRSVKAGLGGGLSQRYLVQRFALFGSVARGDALEGSDVDILVDVDPSIGLRFVELADELEKIIGKKVDLVSSRSIRPEMWKLMEKDLIYV